MTILEALQSAPAGAVLADQSGDVVRLWTLSAPFGDGRAWRSLAYQFPEATILEKGLIRLGGYGTLAEANRAVAQASYASRSVAVRRLGRYDTPEALATIDRWS